MTVLCLLGLRTASTQSNNLRRVTNTTEEGININPSISGDGKTVAFESTEDIAGAGGTDHFRAIRANVSVDPAAFFQMGGTRIPAAGISQDGSRIAFSSKDDPLGANPDGNSEIFLFDGAKLIQITNTSPGDIANRVRNGNFQPSVSDDGRFIAFSSNRDLVSQNSDGNLEVFAYDTVAGAFSQLTNSSGIVGFSDAKISGNGVSVAYIRDNGATPSADRDLLLQPRAGPGPVTVLAANVPSLSMTYGRAISDDGTRVVYSGETATNSSQVFLYDGRNNSTARQITSLGVRATEVPLHPTISGDGTRIAFAARRSISGFSNSDNSIELYTYDLAVGQFARVTSAPAEADGFDGSTLATEVVSSLNDDGTIVAFNFPRALSGSVTAGLENRSEIYVTGTAARPPFGALTAILNGASLGNEPSSIKAVAPDSIAVARGNALANNIMQSQRLPNGSFPTNVGGTTVTVNGRAAQIFFVSPGQVNFLVPPETEIGSADVIVTNADNFPSRASAPTLRAAPGVFTKSGDGIGEGMILNSDTLQEGPSDPSNGSLRLSIFATGARNGVQTLVNIGGHVVNAESVMPLPDMPGLDEVHVRVPADLRGAGAVNLSVQSDGRESNPVTVTFTGDSSRAVFINELLADPPDGMAGDANHDGVRDGTQDEFIELANGTASDAISVGGWTIRTRTTAGTTETTRFTFAAGTTLPAGEAIVVFGGGGAGFNPNDGVFGCAQVFKATSSAGLSLTNSGLTILIRDGADNLITQLIYGGSTGLSGDNNQSLTRSPDIDGNFVQHTSAVGANGRRFSPGLKVDGTPFDSCPRRLTSVTIAPPSASITVGQTTQFNAQAFDQFGRSMNGVTINFASDDGMVATADSVSTNSITSIATATVSGHNPGTAHITASATDGSATVDSTQSTVTVTGPALSINDVSVNEGNSGPTTLTFTVSLSQPAPTAGVTFDIATQDGSATVADNDYAPRRLSAQTIPAGQQTYNFGVTVQGDVNIEANENFFVNVTNVSGASVGDGQGLGTILNDDSPVLSVSDVSANEGNSGTTTFTFTVSSNIPAPTGGITFDIATQDNTATVASNDYVARTLTGQTIPAGQQSYTFDVNVNGDILVEPNESFFLNITNVTNASVGDGQGAGTIQNDDTAVLVINQVYGGGDNSGAPFRNDFVEIYNRGTTTVDFSVTPYSVQYASVGSNFGSAKTNLTGGMIAPGRYFLVQETGGTTNGLALPTPDATGSIALAATSGKVALVAGTTALAAASCPGDDASSPFNPNSSSIADFVGYGSIAANAGHCYEGAGPANAPSNTTADFRKAGGCVDTNENGADFFVASPSPRNSSSPIGDCKPEITINDVTVTEGNSGTANATFTVSLSAASAQPVTVNYATADGTAVAPEDYQTTSGLLTFNPGDLTRTITVLINGDTLDEPSETFFVNLSNATNAVLLDNQAQGTINDNDPSPSLSINNLSIAEGDSGTKPFTFTVSLSAASGQTVTVNYATADNTAAAGSDYQSTSGTLTFNPGDTSKPVTVLVNGDTAFEPNETFFVNLTSPTNASITDSQGQGTIINDDAAPPTPTLFISDASIIEGNSGTSIVTFNVTLSPSSGSTVMVDYATANSTATAGNDYVATSGTLTFAPGDTSKPINVTINGDTLVEPDETFRVNLSNATGGATIGTPFSTGTIQNDDTALLVISQIYPGGGLAGASFTNDFIEVFNRGTTTVDFSLTPYSVQFLSTGGSTWAKTDLTSGALVPGRYFLIKEASGGAVGAALPTADVTGNINLTSTTPGKVALVSGATLLIGNCPGDDGTTPFNPISGIVADFAGYGGTASTANHCYEGAGPASFTSGSNTTADFRKAGGCIDTNDNAADFLVSSPSPRNTSSPLHDCNAPPDLTIDDVAKAEGDRGTTTFTFTVSLSVPAPTSVTFNIATQDGTATVADDDYVPRSLSGQTIATGQQTYTFDVTVNADVNVEPNETFFVNVTSVSGATVVGGQGKGTIQNDDSAVISIGDVSKTEGNSGTKTFSFPVTLSQPAPAGGVGFDITTQDGSATTANNDYAVRTLTNQTIPAGQSTYTFEVTVNGDTVVEPDETFLVNVTNVSNATPGDGQGVGIIQNDDTANLVISQVYGGGNNSGATFRNDFVEIFNRGTTTVDLSITSYSVQYASVGSNFGTSKTNLTAGTIAPGKYFLVQESGGTTNGVALPTPDAAGAITLAAASGKVALVVGTAALSPAACPGDDGSSPFNPNNSSIADLVGYGDSTGTAEHCYEGSGPTAAPSNITADFRKAGGCTDTDQNAADFFVSAPYPRNSTSASNNCAGGAAPNLTISDLTVTEGNSGTTTASFTVTLSAPAQGTDVTFDIATQNDTALSGSDYVARTLTNQVIPAGQTSYTFDVTVNGDTTVEPDETFFVNVTNVAGAAVTDGQGVGTIQHDDLPTLSIDDVSVAEGDTGTKTFTFNVTLSAAAPATVTFDIATADGIAQDGVPGGEDNDYVAHSIPAQTIAAGSSSFNFDVTVNGDLNIEPNETFLVNITNLSGATVLDGQGQGTIQNDDSPVLSINDVSAGEGNSGTTTFTFHVTLSIPAGPGGVSFDIATADGTARDHNPVSEDNDYAAHSLTNQTIPAGQSSYDFDVTVHGDTAVEPDETFAVNVTNVTGATVLDSTGVGTIQNDDAANLVISQIYPGGGLTNASFTNDFIEVFNRGTTTVDFSVTPYSVQFLSTGAITWVRTDLTSGTLSPGRYFLVREASGGAAGAALPTPDTTGTINLTSTTGGKVALVVGAALLTGNCPGDDGTTPFNPVNATVSDFVGYGGNAATANHCYEGAGPASFTPGNNTIADFRKSGGCVDTNENADDFTTSTPNPRNANSAANDCSSGFRPDISINDPAAVTEGDSGTSTLTFNVTLSAPNNTQTVMVNYATADGTATAGADYQSASGTVTFNPTETTKPVVITIDSDLLDEVNETFFVNLSNATNAAILDSQGQGTIMDNDPTPSLSINDLPSIAEGDTGTSTASFTVTLSAASGQTVTVNYATADGSATIADNDYVATNGALTFNPGETTKSVAVTINGDSTFEPNETFFVNLTSPSATATISDPQGQGTIVNDDAAPPTPNTTIDDPSVAEGNAGTKTLDFTVSLSISSATTVTVDYATASAAPASGVATAGTDYVAANGTVTFNPGETSKPITITINGDRLVEPNETFFINLTNASPGATITDSQGVGTITNDDVPLLVISQVYGGGGNSSATYTNDFIEIFNRGTTTVDFAVIPYSVQYAAATSAFSTNKTDITSGMLAPGHYFLIQEASGGAVGAALPTPDAIGTINLAATSGKVALLLGTTLLNTATCPGDDGVTPFNPNVAAISDFLGYGSTASCYEGSGPPTVSSTNSNARSVIRTSNCTDTNVNSADFSNPTTSPTARNTSSPTTSCP